MNGIRHASGASVQVLKSDEDAVETLVELRGYPHQLTISYVVATYEPVLLDCLLVGLLQIW